MVFPGAMPPTSHDYFRESMYILRGIALGKHPVISMHCSTPHRFPWMRWNRWWAWWSHNCQSLAEGTPPWRKVWRGEIRNLRSTKDRWRIKMVIYIYIYIFQHFITFAYTPTHQRGKKVSTSVLVSQSVSASISGQKKHGLCAMNAHGRACSCWRPKMAKKGRTFFGQLCPMNVDFWLINPPIWRGLPIQMERFLFPMDSATLAEYLM